MALQTLEQALAEAIGPSNVMPAEQRPLYGVDGLTPRAVVFPTSVDQVAALMRLAAAERLAVTARGGGTAIALGRPPERLDLVLGTRRMGRVIEYEPADLTATVEAGITLAEFNAVLGRQGQMLPLDAPHADRATVGGILAANTSGPRRFAYGTARDRLIGLRVVDAHGTVLKGGGKVVKNVAGYDLPKMFIGSLGTLGIIVEATFKLAPQPKARLALLGGFRLLEEALEAAQALLRQGLRPTALDLLNGHAMAKVSALTGIGVFTDALYTLALDFGGAASALERQKNEGHRIIARAGGKSQVVDDAMAYEGFWRTVVELGRSTEETASMITRTSVLSSDLARLIHGHEALAESSHLEVALEAHLPAGILRASWWGEGGGPGDDVMLGEAVGTLRKAAGNVGGAFLVESCPSTLKASVDVWGPTGPEFAIMKRLKEQFDPNRILSPGRFVGGL